MRRVKRRWTGLIALILTISPAAMEQVALGQDPVPGTIPGMGSMTSASTQPINYTSAAPGLTSDIPSGPLFQSEVSFIDSAIPMSQVKLLFDANYGDHRPTRDEYIFSKSGTPGSPGWWAGEQNVDWQQLTSYIEIAYQNMFSGFIELPTRFVNPSVNDNDWGMADISIGLKCALLNSPGLSTSFELRGTIPTRTGPGLSTSHYSVEPGLLMNLQLAEMLALEGELRYWVPLCATDYAGDIARYGIGVSFGGPSAIITPVIEVIGWTCIGGKEMVPMPEGFFVRSANLDTIVNGIVGLRLGLGDVGDVYFGFGRAMTGDAWQREFWRLEFRVRF